MVSEISSSLYATRRKELLALVNQLRAVGAQNELDLPRITVIGNQSAGKSSVVEAISGITVPRDAGTCTRCPMECRLSSSPGPWSCRISIRNEYGQDGTRLDEVSETPFGVTITDKSQVELALRRAQFAVLNPHEQYSKILSLSAEQLRQTPKAAPFSQNVVCIDLEGPDLTDLSFIDLPGLIQNAEPEVVELVENMVVSHIKGNCIILVAVPMTDDIENQKALWLARSADPDGRRTIGVLTKPDMLGSGAIKMLNLWLEVIEGRRHRLTHGYYCTRQPDDEARSKGVNATMAREMEAAFFRDTAPWSRSNHRGHFGTNNLISTLSGLLLQIINDTLPRIRQDANSRLEACRNELTAMPKAISEEPATYLLKMLTSYSNTIQNYVMGSQRTTKLIHEHRDSYRALKIAIRRTAPNFVPSAAKDPRQAEFMARLQAEGEEDEEGEDPSLSTEKPFNLTQMRIHIEKSVTRELAGNVPFDAKVSLIVGFQKTWLDSVKACFKKVESSTQTLLLENINRDFERFDSLRAFLKTCILELISQHRATCEQFLEAMLEWECTPFTQNNHYYQASTERWLAKYKAIRNGEDENGEPKEKQQKVAAPAPASSLGRMSSPANFPSFNQAKSSSASANTIPAAAASMTSTTTDASQSATQATFGASTTKSFPTTTTSNGGTSGAAFGATSASANIFCPAPSSSSSAFGSKTTDDFSSFGARNLDNPFKPRTPPQAASMSKTFEEDVQTILSMLKKYDIDVASAEELLGKLTPPDDYEQELRVMAEVRGYFQVAYKRVIDNVPSCIDLTFVRALEKSLQAFLISRFGLGTASASERCAKYLSEDPHVVTRRTEHLARCKMLETVRKELDDFGFMASEK